MNRSAWWFSLPILLGIVGGIIAWTKVRKDDLEMAKWAIIIGIITTVLGFAGGYGVAASDEQIGMFIDDEQINSFEECAMYYEVMQSDPEQCKTDSGKWFVNEP